MPCSMVKQADAGDIIRRLRETDVTLGQLQQEYRLTYGKLRALVLTEISDAEYRDLMRLRAERANVEAIRVLRAARPTVLDCMDCGATLAPGMTQCGKCGSTRFEKVTVVA